MFGTLTVVSADNPASSALGGFKESTAALRHCRQCMATSEEASTKVICIHVQLSVVLRIHVCASYQFQDKDFTLRTLEDHRHQCDILEEDISNFTENSKEYGVNFRSILMELTYFDVCSGALLPDVMHDLLEGVLQYEGNLLLQHCITDCQYFTLAYLNSIIENIELGYMEADDRPTPITSQVLRSDRGLGQKGRNSLMRG